MKDLFQKQLDELKEGDDLFFMEVAQPDAKTRSIQIKRIKLSDLDTLNQTYEVAERLPRLKKKETS